MEKPSCVLFVGCAFALMMILSAARAQANPKNSPAPTPKIIDSTDKDPAALQAEGWHIEKPPYPLRARAAFEQGSMHAVITTGPNGRVVKVVILSAQPHPILDVSTAKWAYANWYGPPFHKLKVPVTYVLR